ncbi:DUF934 domain-containing protein [Pseudohalocynthiibacter aestuariivivens]|uniref:DUF934 domain-containing protein n=1 Tax=Roseovarius pelagicus TaxID=2980108 RepID=A0ABY6DDD7_9RHOB|nr:MULTISPECIES: DUF934 domain-containing protein [Rhodobacterales]QIE44532.1 DUF934 domain-containing protein [Pseudohalocynthiibacter aestuariivivens]UXX83565.1 DUF934 domain-containing protein [Roseovarius pelagicus]
MSVIVTDNGFAPDGWNEAFTPLEEASNETDVLDVPADADLDAVVGKIPSLRMVRVDFPNSADGRGFTIARQLRLHGYTGRLRARGHVIADQYAMARRSGFDEVEIDTSLAARQPEEQWLFRANWQANDYQARVRG